MSVASLQMRMNTGWTSPARPWPRRWNGRAHSIRENPLLIQKSVADKLSDKVHVIIAPTDGSGGVVARALLSAPNTPGESAP